MSRLTESAAFQKMLDRFPFPDYIIPECGSYDNIAATVAKAISPGSSILDFGAGACDKTALLASLGYKCSACDDLNDDWHLSDGNREKIISFAKSYDIDFRLLDGGSLPFAPESFDMVMAHDVIEHLHESPRNLIFSLLKVIRQGGLLLITVPNAVNLRKRIDVLMGRTNMPDFEIFYRYPGTWRGHVREYVEDDLSKLAQFSGLEIVELRGCHHMLQKVPASLRPLYRAFSALVPACRDSWTLLARKPQGWIEQA